MTFPRTTAGNITIGKVLSGAFQTYVRNYTSCCALALQFKNYIGNVGVISVASTILKRSPNRNNRSSLFLSSIYSTSTFSTSVSVSDCTRKLNPLVVSIRSLSISPPMKMSKTALVVIANGSEEIELVTPIDTLRRAGVEVTVAGLNDSNPVVCSRNVTIVPDTSFKEATSAGQVYDAVLLPGGLKGAEAFCNSAELGDFLKEQEKGLRLIAAICAAPTALKFHGIGLGKSITSYPSVQDKLIEGDQYTYKEDRVVPDGNFITSRGPGSALEWSLAVAAFLVGKEKALEVGHGMLAHCV